MLWRAQPHNGDCFSLQHTRFGLDGTSLASAPVAPGCCPLLENGPCGSWSEGGAGWSLGLGAVDPWLAAARMCDGGCGEADPGLTLGPIGCSDGRRAGMGVGVDAGQAFGPEYASEYASRTV
jgi:hypothetical protein